MARRRGNGFCGSAEHLVNRRAFLGGTALATAGLASDMTRLDVLRTPAMANQLRSRGKRVMLLWWAGAQVNWKPGIRNRIVPQVVHLVPFQPTWKGFGFPSCCQRWHSDWNTLQLSLRCTRRMGRPVVRHG